MLLIKKQCQSLKCPKYWLFVFSFVYLQRILDILQRYTDFLTQFTQYNKLNINKYCPFNLRVKLLLFSIPNEVKSQNIRIWAWFNQNFMLIKYTKAAKMRDKQLEGC